MRKEFSQERRGGTGRGSVAAVTSTQADASVESGNAGQLPSEGRRQRTAVLVLGMHRSGTSALTGLIHRLGAKAPSTPLPAASDNPKGFAESARLLEVHNRILASAGSDWRDWTAFNPDWVHSPAAEPFVSELGQVFDQEYPDASFVAIKDPRICRFAPLWFEVLNERHIAALPIIAFRNPLEVAASLNARGGMPLMHGMLLWLRHVLDAERASRGMKRAFVDHRHVLEDWRAVAGDLRQRFGLRWPRYSPSVQAELDAWIDGSLHHQVATEKAALSRANVADWVRTTYATLLKISSNGETATALKTLDQVAAEFDRSSDVFGPFCHQYETKANWSSNERQKAVAARQAAEAKLQTSEARTAELQRMNDSTAQQLQSAEQQAAKLSQELAEAKKASEAKLQTLEARIAELQRASGTAAEQLTKSEQASAKASQLLAERTKASDAQVKTLEARVADLQQANADAARNLEKAKQDAAKADRQRLDTTRASETRIATLEARIAELQQAGVEAGESLARAEQEARASRELAADKLALEAAVAALEARTVELRAEAADVAGRLQKSEQHAAQLSDELAVRKAESDTAAQVLEARIAELQTANANAAELLSGSEQYVAQLKQQLSAEKRLADATARSLQARAAEAEQAAKVSAAQQVRISEISAAQAVAEERIAKLTAQASAAEKLAEAARTATPPVETNRKTAPAAQARSEPGQAQQAKPAPSAAVKAANGADSKPLPRSAAPPSSSVAPVAKIDPAATEIDLETVRPYFDREFYLRRYPDIARALDRGTLKNGDPLIHYVQFGGKEKRDPNPWFSSDFYLTTHPEVAKAGINPLVHYVAKGRAEGRAYSHFSAGAPLFDAFSSVLDMPPKAAEALLNERRSDLRQRLESGELGRMVERASELEPLVRHSSLAAIRAGMTPFRNEGLTGQIVAVHGLQKQADWKRAKAIVLIPWVHLSGATRIAGHLCHALARIYGPEEVVVVRTETSEFQFPEWFPPGCRHIDFAGQTERLRPESRARVLVEFLRSLCPAAIFNVNSRLMWDVMEPYGKALADSAALYAYLFCNDKNVHGDWVGYPVRNFHRYFDDFAAVITDSRYLATSLHRQFQLPPDQQGKLVTFDTPADATLQIAARVAAQANRRPQVFWAGRFDRQKRVDVAYEIARRMPDVDFRMWGEAVLDKTSGGMKVPANVVHEGVYQAFADLPLGECDAWLYTSEWDGVPNMLIEVAAAAVPLVGSLAGGTSDILAPDLSYPIADIEDAGAYVDAIRTILGKPETARENALKLREKIYRERNEAVYLDAVRQVLPKESLT